MSTMSAKLDFASSDRIMRFLVDHPKWFGSLPRCMAAGGVACIPALLTNLVEVYWFESRKFIWQCESIYFFVNYILVMPFLAWLTMVVFKDFASVIRVMCDERLFLVSEDDVKGYYERFNEMMSGRWFALVFLLLLLIESEMFRSQVVWSGGIFSRMECTFVDLLKYGNYIWLYGAVGAYSVGAVLFLLANVHVGVSRNRLARFGMLVLLACGYYFACLKNVMSCVPGGLPVCSASLTSLIHLPVAVISLYIVVQLVGRCFIFLKCFDGFFCDLKVSLEPYNSDMCCGFSVVGRFIVKYVLISSVAVVAILASYLVFSVKFNMKHDEVLSITLMSGLFLVEVMFVRLIYYKVHVAMKARRDAMLDGINEKYNKILEECDSDLLTGECTEDAKKLQDLRKRILEYNVYPVQLSDLKKFIIPSSAVQLVTFVVQIYEKLSK